MGVPAAVSDGSSSGAMISRETLSQAIMDFQSFVGLEKTGIYYDVFVQPLNDIDF